MLNPQILWAQDRKSIFLTFEIRDIREQNINFSKNNITIQGRNDKNDFDISVDLYSEINCEESTWSIKPKGIICTLNKNVEKFWSKLSPVKMNNLKIDWTKWINEDDSDLEEDYPFDKNEIMSGFENFKKELPEDVLEKDFEQLMPELGLDSLNIDTMDDVSNINNDNNTNEDNTNEHNVNKKDLEIERLENVEIDETGYDASNELSVSDNTIQKNDEVLEVNKNATINNIEELNDEDLDINV